MTLVEPTPLAEALSVAEDDRLEVAGGKDGRSHLSQREGVLLADAAKALLDAHERICGCDRPGRSDVCVAGDEFAALDPPRDA